MIVKLKVPDLLATLAMMFLLSGLQLIPTAGRSISVGLILPNGTTATGKYDPLFLTIGRSSLFGLIPFPVILLAIVAVTLFVLTERTRLGRLLFATGGNEVATRLAGANTAKIKTFAYVLSGTLAAFGGIIVAARVGRGDVSSGASLLMDSVAASLIGFAVLGLRRPNVLGTIIGAVFVGILLNGLTMLNAPITPRISSRVSCWLAPLPSPMASAAPAHKHRPSHLNGTNMIKSLRTFGAVLLAGSILPPRPPPLALRAHPPRLIRRRSTSPLSAISAVVIGCKLLRQASSDRRMHWASTSRFRRPAMTMMQNAR